MVTEDEMVGWQHRLNGYEFEQTLGDGEGQGSLVCCSSWSHKKTSLSNWKTTTCSRVEAGRPMEDLGTRLKKPPIRVCQ